MNRSASMEPALTSKPLGWRASVGRWVRFPCSAEGKLRSLVVSDVHTPTLNSPQIRGVFFVALLALAGCTKDPYYRWEDECDAAQRERVFIACVVASRGPDSLTASPNDGAEVIDECSDAARRIACRSVRVCLENCPPAGGAF